jgi:hypothetical protein
VRPALLLRSINLLVTRNLHLSVEYAVKKVPAQQQQDTWVGPMGLGLPDAGALPAAAPLRPDFMFQKKNLGGGRLWAPGL